MLEPITFAILANGALSPGHFSPSQGDTLGQTSTCSHTYKHLRKPKHRDNPDRRWGTCTQKGTWDPDPQND